MKNQIQHCHDRAGRRKTRRIASALGGALLTTVMLIPATPAMAEDRPVKATPNPFVAEDDLPGCFGNLNATMNHDSGIQEHSRDSKGPGFYFRDGQLFQQVRGDFWPVICGPGAGTG